MRRRDLITLLGGAAVTWPLTAQAQKPAMPVVGYFYSGTRENSSYFREGLSESSFSEGQNVAIEYRWANNEPERLLELAADLVRRRVAVIVALGTSASVLAAKAATTTIPIVFRTGGDPVELGLVASLNRPGGNVTGVNAMSLETVTKRLGLLHELLAAAMRFAVIINPNDPNADQYIKELQAAASDIGAQVEFFRTRTTWRLTLHLPILCHRSCTTFDSLVVQAFRASGVEAPQPAVHVDALSMRLKLAATGRFLAIVPASIMKFSDKQASIKILPVELPTTQSSIGIITLKNRTVSPLARAFIECAREVAKPLAKKR